MTLNFVGLKPRLYIQELYVPALNNSTMYNSTTLNASIYIDLKFKRVLAVVPISYGDVNITLFYNSVGYSAVVPRFDQGGKKTARRRVVVEASGLPWDGAVEKVSGGSTVAFKVAAATRYRLEYCDADDHCRHSGRKRLVVEGEVWVDGYGEKVSKNPIRLR
ncbi:hypothetical protein AAHA92_10883 [Salvia divinorum]|uniref:Uncharacterized protein n=1 Tax=Salvia divinorum TaxID=28513 RepID=A0ABD1HW51_SALDI